MRYLVAIPTFNEARGLGAILTRVRRYAPELLVIDDGSTDGTPSLLRPGAGLHLIRHSHNLGYGQSLIDAFEFARRGEYEWLITIDCDEQHEPESIPEFLAAARDGDADIISGSRYLRPHDGDSHPPPDRRAVNQKITDLLNECLGLGITDAFCGFKAYRVSALGRLDITVPGYGMPLQLWVQAARQGLRIREIPVRLIYNDYSRQFGGGLDEPDTRLMYYHEILIHELAAQTSWRVQTAEATCWGPAVGPRSDP